LPSPSSSATPPSTRVEYQSDVEALADASAMIVWIGIAALTFVLIIAAFIATCVVIQRYAYKDRQEAATEQELDLIRDTKGIQRV
jgi:hypothetical protein